MTCDSKTLHQRPMFFRLIGLFLLLSFLNGGAAGAEETGKKILTETCSACHNLTGPSSQTLQDLWTRKGPDLFYAGNKYKANWVESWLQKPTRIRPAGMYYGNHVKPGEKGDQVDPSTLTIHPVLSQQDAKAVTKAVMTLKGKGDLIHPGDYQPGTISETMGEMLFDKFRGCLACHEIEPDYGGLSGPELFTAAKRLQEDYMISFMRNPQAWEPKAFMPNKHLAETDLQKLVHYMRFLSREDHP